MELNPKIIICLCFELLNYKIFKGDIIDEDVVKEYQRKNNLTIDGVIGKNTIASLIDNVNKIPFTKTVDYLQTSNSNITPDIFNIKNLDIQKSVLALTISPLSHNNINLKTNISDNERLWLHHTGGGNASGAIQWWKTRPYKIGTPFIIDRDGTIHQCFNPLLFWSTHLRHSGFEYEQDIAIELVSWGQLKINTNGSTDTYSPFGLDSIILNKDSSIIELENPMIQNNVKMTVFQDYTNQQLLALHSLIAYFKELYNITKEYEYIHLESYSDWTFKKDLKVDNKFLHFHSEVNSSRYDCTPTPNLLKTINTF